MAEVKTDRISISGDGGKTWVDIKARLVKVEHGEPLPPNVIDSTCRVVETGTAIVRREVNGR